MVSRKQEIKLQIHQFLDALILGLVLWLCYALRSNGLIVWDSLVEIPSFADFAWMLIVIMPFGPLLLELQGFYQSSLEKPDLEIVCRDHARRSLAGADPWLVRDIHAPLCPKRSVLILFGVVAPLVLLVKERFVVWNDIRRLRSRRGWRAISDRWRA